MIYTTIILVVWFSPCASAQVKRRSIVLEYNDREPIYIQIINSIKAQIALGVLKPGDQLPSIKDYALTMKVNPNTMARVYSILEHDEILSKQKGIGTFISSNSKIVGILKEQLAHESALRFIAEMQRLGFDKQEIIFYLKDLLVKFP
jgi:DNA-binding transcriptional regulator YhcF (GntR family)